MGLAAEPAAVPENALPGAINVVGPADGAERASGNPPDVELPRVMRDGRFDLRQEFADALAVVALSDERKGEKLYVLHTLGASLADLSETLKSLDTPNLWKPNPKDWYSVDALPMLGSGKLDYQSMKAIAGGAAEV